MLQLFTGGKKKKKAPLLIVIIIVVVIKVGALPSWCRPPRPAGATAAATAASGFLLGGDEVDDGRDDGAVLGLAVLPVHRRRVPDFLLQQGVQLFLQTLVWKRTEEEFRQTSFCWIVAVRFDQIHFG